jgi:hypothetical protein
MFNVLVSATGTAWETDQLMRFQTDRFKEHSDGIEAKHVSLDKPDTLKLLESISTLLMYERGTEGPNANVARYGHLQDIRITGKKLTFRFIEEGRFSRAVVEEFSDRLGLDKFEHGRTHWAIKDGDIPSAMLAKLLPSYDVVFSFAGEDRRYVKQVAEYLRSKDVKVFYDGFEEANLWGKDLAEHLDSIYRHSGKYCVIFISEYYAEKMWTRHERRSALARALQEREEYMLPARFDATELPGILPTVGYISLSDKSPIDFGKLILEKLGKS